MALRVEANLNSTGFKAGLDEMRTQAKAFSNSVEHEIGSSWGGIGKTFAKAFAGLATVEGVKGVFDRFIDTGKQIKELSEQADMSTDSWQKWADAVDKAGLSTEGFMRVVEALRSKRTEAMNDPKARGELNRLGFTDADITGNMDGDEFIRRALENSSGGDLQRKYLADIIGNRGLKYGTALEKLPGAKVNYSPDDIAAAENYSVLEKKIEKFGETEMVGVNRLAHDHNYQKAAGVLFGRFFQNIVGRGWLWDKGWDRNAGLYNIENGMSADYRPVTAMRDGKPLTAPQSTAAQVAASGRTPVSSEPDPLDAVLAKQREEMAIQEQSRQQRLADSQRGLMTIGDRRASIQGELARLLPQIAERQAKMHGEDFLSDADKNELAGVTGKAREFEVNKRRQAYQAQTDDLVIRSNRDREDLREKSLNFGADSMSKVGLYEASAVAFNPLLNIQQRQLAALNQIAHNTAPKGTGQTPHQHDPHSP